MKMFACVLAATAIATIAPAGASAADLEGGYEEQQTITVVERERVIERRYYAEPRNYEEEIDFEPGNSWAHGRDYAFEHGIHHRRHARWHDHRR